MENNTFIEGNSSQSEEKTNQSTKPLVYRLIPPTLTLLASLTCAEAIQSVFSNQNEGRNNAPAKAKTDIRITAGNNLQKLEERIFFLEAKFPEMMQQANILFRTEEKTPEQVAELQSLADAANDIRGELGKLSSYMNEILISHGSAAFYQQGGDMDITRFAVQKRKELDRLSASFTHEIFDPANRMLADAEAHRSNKMLADTNANEGNGN